MAYRVSVAGEGVDMTRDVSEEVALAVLGLLMGVQAPSLRQAGTHAASRVAAGNSDGGGDPELTLGEFLLQTKANTNPERIAAIAMYLRDYRGEPSVARADLPELFQEAGEVPPKNASRDVSKAVKKRLVAADHSNPGRYRVTKTGERAVKGDAES
jgi:hypothetical protein